MEDTIPVTREVTSPTENPMDLMEMIIHMVKKITTVLMITMITMIPMITNTRRTTTIMTSLNMSITKKNTNTNMVINLKIMASIIKIFRKCILSFEVNRYIFRYMLIYCLKIFCFKLNIFHIFC